MPILYWLKHPKQIIPRIRYWIWEKQNPDKPWLCPDTVKFCESNLNKTMKGIEFGSGRSTCWLAPQIAYLISIEQDAQWSEQVQNQLEKKQINNVDFRHVALNHPYNEPERLDYHPTPDYVAVADSLPDQSIDFAMVDGHYRTNCIAHLIPKIAPGGFIMVDDVNMWPSRQNIPVPENWPVADDSTNGIKRCMIWQRPLS